MADPFVAEIRIFPFNFAPKGWAWCNGQLLPLSQNTALFSLLGTTYGGDGKSTFALPDLQGNVPLHPGQGPGLSLYDLGQMGGSETVTLLVSEIPLHTHQLMASADPADQTQASPTPVLSSIRRRICIHSRCGEYNHGLRECECDRRRSAAQQHDAVPYLLLQYRPPGCLPTTSVIGGANHRSTKRMIS